MYRIAFADGDYLEHHGIEGQKWGRRRYQNPDGTLTEEGKLRYAKRKSTTKAVITSIAGGHTVLGNLVGTRIATKRGSEDRERMLNSLRKESLASTAISSLATAGIAALAGGPAGAALYGGTALAGGLIAHAGIGEAFIRQCFYDNKEDYKKNNIYFKELGKKKDKE